MMRWDGVVWRGFPFSLKEISSIWIATVIHTKQDCNNCDFKYIQSYKQIFSVNRLKYTGSEAVLFLKGERLLNARDNDRKIASFFFANHHLRRKKMRNQSAINRMAEKKFTIWIFLKHANLLKKFCNSKHQFYTRTHYIY